jgi:hypothetical protein
MSVLTAFLKALLDWLTGLAREDKKAGDADDTPRTLKERWRRRIEEQEKKVKKNENDSDTSSE